MLATTGYAGYVMAANAVATATGVPVAEILRRRGPGKIRNDLAFARALAIYLAVTGFDVRQAHLARALDRPRWRIWKSCRDIEERRDDPQVDGLLTTLEERLVAR